MAKAKFWNWATVENERVLQIDGVIADESWFDDDVTPEMFRRELFSSQGDVILWINSPGGDVFAASQIYTMLRDYGGGKITVKIDGLAASAASVIAMGGDEVLMSPTSMMMIHNPATAAFGDSAEMQRAIEMLDEVKESIINAYEIKTGMQRAKIARLMDAETWMNARKAVELHFADGIIESEQNASDSAVAFEVRTATADLFRRAVAMAKDEESKKQTEKERSVKDLMKALEEKRF